MNNNFKKFNIDENIIKSLSSLGYKVPSPVQEEVIPELLKSRNVIVKSKTGSGKTASFGIPICENIDINDNSVQGLIIAPTRELALQIKEEIQDIGRLKKVRVSAIFGKQPLKDQIAQLKQRVHIVVATPGRILDHIGRGTIDLNNIKYFVIDEADKMLNKGFIEDMESILNKLPDNACKGLFSATLDENINTICNKYMDKSQKISIEEEIKQKKQISELCINTDEENRYETLKNIIYTNCPKSLIIFVNTKEEVDKLYVKMKQDKFSVKEIHGDMSQDKRLFIIKDFKESKFNILISSDITSRGIHIDDIAMVINYQVPRDKENYVHRIGRTGRIDKLGQAITIYSKREEKYLREIENYTGEEIQKLSDFKQKEIEEGKLSLIKIQEELKRNVNSSKKVEKKKDSEVTKIYLNIGKKKKIRVIDIVGTLSNTKELNNEDIGVIEVGDICSYVDILNNKGNLFLKNHKEILIKKKKVKVKKDRN